MTRAMFGSVFSSFMLALFLSTAAFAEEGEVAPTPPAGDNLIADPGFEAPLVSTPWQAGSGGPLSIMLCPTGECAPCYRRNGDGALRFAARVTADVWSVQQQVTLPPAERYEMELYLAGCNGASNGSISVALTGLGSQNITLAPGDENGRYRYHKLVFQPGGGGQHAGGAATLTIANANLAGAHVSIDDVRLVARQEGEACAVPASLPVATKQTCPNEFDWEYIVQDWSFRANGTFSLHTEYRMSEGAANTIEGTYCVDDAENPGIVYLRLNRSCSSSDEVTFPETGACEFEPGEDCMLVCAPLNVEWAATYDASEGNLTVVPCLGDANTYPCNVLIENETCEGSVLQGDWFYRPCAGEGDEKLSMSFSEWGFFNLVATESGEGEDEVTVTGSISGDATVNTGTQTVQITNVIACLPGLGCVSAGNIQFSYTLSGGELQVESPALLALLSQPATPVTFKPEDYTCPDTQPMANLLQDGGFEELVAETPWQAGSGALNQLLCRNSQCGCKPIRGNGYLHIPGRQTDDVLSVQQSIELPPAESYLVTVQAEQCGGATGNLELRLGDASATLQVADDPFKVYTAEFSAEEVFGGDKQSGAATLVIENPTLGEGDLVLDQAQVLAKPAGGWPMDETLLGYHQTLNCDGGEQTEWWYTFRPDFTYIASFNESMEGPYHDYYGRFTVDSSGGAPIVTLHGEIACESDDIIDTPEAEFDYCDTLPAPDCLHDSCGDSNVVSSHAYAFVGDILTLSPSGTTPGEECVWDHDLLGEWYWKVCPPPTGPGTALKWDRWEFYLDGTFFFGKTFVNSGYYHQMYGTYRVDTSATPHRLYLTVHAECLYDFTKGSDECEYGFELEGLYEIDNGILKIVTAPTMPENLAGAKAYRPILPGEIDCEAIEGEAESGDGEGTLDGEGEGEGGAYPCPGVFEPLEALTGDWFYHNCQAGPDETADYYVEFRADGGFHYRASEAFEIGQDETPYSSMGGKYCVDGDFLRLYDLEHCQLGEEDSDCFQDGLTQTWTFTVDDDSLTIHSIGITFMEDPMLCPEGEGGIGGGEGGTGGGEGEGEGIGGGEGEGEGIGGGEGEGEGEGIGGGEGEGAAPAVEALSDFSNGDTDESGTLSESEANTLGISAVDFDTLDQNDDGEVTVAELLHAAGEASPVHSVDTNADSAVSLGELLRAIQLYNAGGYSCAADADSEDGYMAEAHEGKGGDPDCPAHAGDYAPADGVISLSELLRAIQLYNSGQYSLCESGEDGFCLGG